MVPRPKQNLLTGDEKHNNTSLLYTTWGLRALMETFDTQEEAIRKAVPSIVTAYVRAVTEKVERENVTVGQEYLYVLSPTVEERLAYEDRSDWGGIFLTLLSLRTRSEFEGLLEETN